MNALLMLVAVVLALASAKPQTSDDLHVESRRQVNNSSCGNLDFREMSGVFTTPNYPHGYSNNMLCVYTFQRPNVTRFWMYFSICDCEIEDQRDCRYDSITFGNSNKSCGSLTGNEYMVWPVNGSVDVTFRSDQSVVARGCKIAYSVYRHSRCPDVTTSPMMSSPPWRPTVSTTQTATTESPINNPSCGNLDFRDSSGVFTTPNYPHGYSNNMLCVYTFQRQICRPFWVSFSICDCDIEDHFTCRYDSLTFGNSNKTCGILTGNHYWARSVNGSVDVTFQTDGSVVARGCNIAYSFHGSARCPDARPTSMPTSTETVTTESPSPDVFHYIRLMNDKARDVEEAFEEYRSAVQDVIDILI